MTTDMHGEPHCPFCEASIQDAVFARTNGFLAIYNIAPILPGHSLIIPEEHVTSLLELTDNEVCEMVRFSRTVVRNLMRIFDADGFNWTVQEGEAAGQTIGHLHLHLIPRSGGDLPQPGDWYPRLREAGASVIDSPARKHLSSGEMSSIVARIRREWAA